MVNATTLGMDPANEGLAMCAMDVTGAVLYSKIMKRNASIPWAEQLTPSTGMMEACGSERHWAGL